VNRRWTAAGLLAAVSSLWLFAQAALVAPPGRTDTPRIVVTEPYWKNHREDGNLARTVRARRLEKTSESAPARLFEPEIRFRDRQQRDWEVTARQGEMNDPAHTIQLQDDVVVKRSGEATQALVAHTEALEIDYTGNHIRSDAPVRVSFGRWELSASGLRADADSQRVTLLHAVRGKHD